MTLKNKENATSWKYNFNPGYFESKIKMGTSRFVITASTGDISSFTLEKVDELYSKETHRHKLLNFNSKLNETFALKLQRATDSFIIKKTSSGEYSDCGISLVL